MVPNWREKKGGGTSLHRDVPSSVQFGAILGNLTLLAIGWPCLCMNLHSFFLVNLTSFLPTEPTGGWAELVN